MDDTRNRILRAACKAVRQYGLDGVRIQNISELAGLSPGALYRYFDSKETLLETCFADVNRQVMELFARMKIDREKLREDPVNSVRMLWLPYFRFWTARPDETVFYYNYRNTPGFRSFDRKSETGNFQSMADVFEWIRDTFPGLRSMNRTTLFIHMLSATVMYAKCVVEGILPDSEKTEDEIFRLLMTGLSGFLEKE